MGKPRKGSVSSRGEREREGIEISECHGERECVSPHTRASGGGGFFVNRDGGLVSRIGYPDERERHDGGSGRSKPINRATRIVRGGQVRLVPGWENI